MPTTELEETKDAFDVVAALREFTNQLGNLAYTPKTDNKKRQQTIIQHQWKRQNL